VGWKVGEEGEEIAVYRERGATGGTLKI